MSDSAHGLLDRDCEIGAIEGALTVSHRGSGQVLVVEAEGGIGKTALLRLTADEARAAGFRVLSALASELEQDFAYGCVRQLLEAVVVRADEAQAASLFEGPAMFSKPLFEPTVRSAADTGDPFSTSHGLYWLVANMAADQPLLLLLDDAQWADEESLRVCGFLASRLHELSVCLTVAVRTGTRLQSDLARLVGRAETRVLRPRELGATATTIMCKRRLGPAIDSDFAAACHEATGGNPFYLEALLREVGEQGLARAQEGAQAVRGVGSAAVMQALLLRISNAPPAAGALVRAVAVLGDGAGLADCCQLAEISETDGARAADHLVTLGVLKRDETLAFVHPIVRESVHADIGPHERAEAHSRAARVLTARGASAERVAAQLAGARPAGDAARVALFRQVAADATANGAPATAAAWLTRALAEPPLPEERSAVLLELGIAEHRLGRRDATAHLGEAYELNREPSQRAVAARWLALNLTRSGDADEALHVIDGAIDSLTPDAEPALALALEAELAYHARYASPDLRIAAEQRLTRPRTLRGDNAAQRLLVAHIACVRARHSDSAEQSLRHLGSAIDVWAEPAEWDLTSGQAFYDVVIALVAADAFDPAQRLVEQAVEHARAQGAVSDLAYATCWRGWIHMRRGEVAQAGADARLGLDLLGVDGMPGRRFAVALLVEALVEADEAGAAEDVLRRAGFDEEVPPLRATNYLLRAQALLRLARGQTARGVEALLEFGRREEAWGAANPLATRWRARATEALLAVGEAASARELALADVERARRWGAPTSVGMALRAAALTHEQGPTEKQLNESVALLARAPARLEHARALTDLGAALRRAGRRSDARVALEQAVATCDEGGARELGRRARIELRAAGGRSSDPYGAPLAQLTTSEQRVAELAARGLSNPQIAQALFVTRKTVETHLGHVYAKLGISGRAQLPAVLAPAQPPG